MTNLRIRGINYDAGVRYSRDFHSRPCWRLDDVRRDFIAIREQLGCNAVGIMASDNQRLIEAGEIAASLGLSAWLQPRRFEASGREVAANLQQLAGAAETLRLRGHQICLNVGCELTLSSKGMVPGGSFYRRGLLLPKMLWLKPYWDRKLNSLLRKLTETARAHFGGPLTYGAGDWETVDWTMFDYIGLDTYLAAYNRDVYAEQIRQRVGRGKPVVITEFGCCAYQGAADLGPNGFEVLDYRSNPPSIRAGTVRDEQVQADYLAASLDAFESAGAAGAFAFAFSEPMLPHTSDPLTDADMASFGIVKVTQPASEHASEQWAPKAAFSMLAKRYQSDPPT
ncbi:abortive infection protein [Natronospirillum operosum]|uniref:Abortive infection protein n=1 Tax=Natronospirillum operosum TaxID=2759953 RepID=A0A4Z0WJV5_9GAMM|nr:abortive infection protein [Natronospirillum operosum]TGG95445.1 abortive infection protein [Natronospirillum operosum]